MTTFTNDQSIRVMVVAPSMTCWGLERLVQSAAPRCELAGSASGLSALRLGLAQSPADVVVVDLDAVSEQDLAACLADGLPARVVVVTASQDTEALDQAVMQGVRGIVRRTDPPEVLLRAIERVHGGELWIDRASTSRIFMQLARQKAQDQDDPDRLRIGTLTPREREMIAAVARDTSVPGKVIASRLCISEHTLRNHLSSIYAKLGLNNRLDLYAFATRHRLDRAV